MKIIEWLPRVAAFAALTACLMVPLEALLPREEAPRGPRATRALLQNLAWLLLGAATLRWVVQPVIEALQPSHVHTAAWRIALAFLAAEVMAYWSHRLMHELPWLARFHRVHHRHGTLTWHHAWQQHPVDLALHTLAVGLPGVLLGVPMSQFVTVVLIRRLYTALLHANVGFTLGPLEGVISSPRSHHQHHRARREAMGNYAGLLPWLDALFGTRL